MNSNGLMLRVTVAVCLLVVCALAAAKKAPKPVISAPASVFGFGPGAAYHLADYEQITSYSRSWLRQPPSA